MGESDRGRGTLQSWPLMKVGGECRAVQANRCWVSGAGKEAKNMVRCPPCFTLENHLASFLDSLVLCWALMMPP